MNNLLSPNLFFTKVHNENNDASLRKKFYEELKHAENEAVANYSHSILIGNNQKKLKIKIDPNWKKEYLEDACRIYKSNGWNCVSFHFDNTKSIDGNWIIIIDTSKNIMSV